MGPKGEKEFYYLTIFFVIILAVMIYISVTLPSKEQFIELNWQVFTIENSTSSNKASCVMTNCSISGNYKIGKIILADKEFNVILTDLITSDIYNTLCIDFNHNEKYCEVGEGPFNERDSFIVDSSAFNILYFTDNAPIIANYPKKVDVNNFTIRYVITSHYSNNITLKVDLFVNDTLQSSGLLKISPNEKITLDNSVSLPTKGLYYVKILVDVVEFHKESYIGFWVEYIS